VDNHESDQKRFAAALGRLAAGLVIIRHLLANLPMPIGLPKIEDRDPQGLFADLQRARALIPEEVPDVPQTDADMLDGLLLHWMTAAELAQAAWNHEDFGWRIDAAHLSLIMAEWTIREIVSDLPYLDWPGETPPED
jgi:hypothetical protein